MGGVKAVTPARAHHLVTLRRYLLHISAVDVGRSFGTLSTFSNGRVLLELGSNHLIPQDQHELELVDITDETAPQFGLCILYLLPVFSNGVTLCQRLRDGLFEAVNDRWIRICW